MASAASFGAAALATAITSVRTRALAAPPVGYLCLGLGFIGCMTSIVAPLREQGLAAAAITAFYMLLGVAVVASSWLWAGLLQRWRIAAVPSERRQVFSRPSALPQRWP